MKFTVNWHPDAEQELTQIWLGARDRQRITESAEQIDGQLRTNPDQRGESREDDRRILMVAPLAVSFRVLTDDLRVVVLKVWRYRT